MPHYNRILGYVIKSELSDEESEFIKRRLTKHFYSKHLVSTEVVRDKIGFEYYTGLYRHLNGGVE